MLLKSSFSLILFISLFFTLSSCRLKVVSPDSARSQLSKDIEYRLARTDKIPYGSALTGTLVLADPIDACTSLLTNKYNLDGSIQVPIFVVRKGGCKYAVKTMYAQIAGAKMVIIVDDSDELPTRPIGVNSMSDLYIPTIIVKKSDGNKLIDAIKASSAAKSGTKNAFVTVSMVFPSGPMTERVALDFWFSPADSVDSVYKFLREIRSFVAESKKSFDFTPHYVTWYCNYCKDSDYNTDDVDCLSGGRYCSPDPDFEGPLSGSNVVFEDLRQICIWKNYPEKWWDYVDAFGHKCVNHKDQEDCVQRLLKDIGFNSEQSGKITNCMDSSFEKRQGSYGPINKKIDDNVLLRNERLLQNEFDISTFPTLYINHQAYTGNLNNVTIAIKTACEIVMEPSELCKRYLSDTVIVNSISTKKMINFLIAMVIIVVIILFFYRRIQRREMNKEMNIQVSQMVSQYFAINENKGLMKEGY